jgi:hypothetical protein
MHIDHRGIAGLIDALDSHFGQKVRIETKIAPAGHRDISPPEPPGGRRDFHEPVGMDKRETGKAVDAINIVPYGKHAGIINKSRILD